MSYEKYTLITAPPELLIPPEEIKISRPPNLSKLPTEVLDWIFERVVEPLEATQHSAHPRRHNSTQILNICLTCKRFYKIAGRHLYQLCVVNYLRKKEIPANSDPWKKRKPSYSVFISPQDVKPEHWEKDYSASFLKSGGCVRALQIGSAESLFTYPPGSIRTHHRITTLKSVLKRLVPGFTHLTNLTLDRSSIDYSPPLDDFFRSIHLIFTKCPTLETFSLSISYCQHESSISSRLLPSSLARGQKPCLPFPVLKELSINILHKTNYLPKKQTVHHWPLELLGAMLNLSSRSVTKLTFSCTTSYPPDVLVEKKKRVPLSYIFKNDLVPDYADFMVKARKWDLPSVNHLVFDMDLDSLKVFDRYFGATLANVVKVEFNVRKNDRWQKVIRKINLGSFPALEDLIINSYADDKETGRIIHCLDREANLSYCDRLKVTDVVVCSDVPYIADCQVFWDNLKKGYGPCVSSLAGSCRSQDPPWKVVF
ncbi:hypothetical protein TWF106_000667 [Orbilia oligospora]|uniref:F-box domain-containing protein n=1 Tax=Orbilia oligospora TaxID=2813651 RepID=A0A6G1M2Y2_ORBOL|nr:hypothetical protein TWF788_005320 [Orbilia oligospora]KAF3206580.1 hypothetical protein TWF106_000667 [Orbilia oligospora]KAF3215992.1 hypothetical protein TWF191_009155 [Orbilia oligospora]KAF3243619.1 hypothetical protein TWF192_008005 [Orbilia oligospora]